VSEEEEATVVRPPPRKPPAEPAALLDAMLEAPPAAPPAAPEAPAVLEAALDAPPVAAPPRDPPPSPSLRILPPLERLEREPTRFALDQAIALLARQDTGGDPLRLRVRTSGRLGLPAGAVIAAKPATGELVAATFGLVGPGGVLPRHVTGAVAAENRKRSEALHAFLDLPARRFLGLFALAGAKYRPARDPQPAETALAAAVGLGTPGLRERLGVPLDALLFHAGNLATRSRSAERLRAMLEAEIGEHVEVEEFAGGWVRLPPTEQTRLPRGRAAPGASGLGQGAALGAQVWDSQARIVLRFGPLPRREFERLLPGTPRHRRLAELTRLYAGLDTGFAFNLVLKPEAVPPLALGGDARLGWSSWMTAPKPRRLPATDPLFEPRPA
jgi:type VI secretion system protein ImpH